MSKISLEQKYDWYERSVQTPETEVIFMRKWFKKFHGRQPLTLREDFCGTGAISCEWAKSNPEAQAFGVDLDPEPIGMGKRTHWDRLNAKAKSRVKYIEGNVLDARGFKTDVICAFNFSYFIFKKRSQLLNYFQQAHKGLGKQGMFFMDLFGGPDSQTVVEESRKVAKDLTYYWDCQTFNPINAECTFAIHFKDGKGKKHMNVFTYDWRLWTVAELREILEEAGFSKTVFFWEGDDDKGGGNGIYEPTEVVENCQAWVGYIVALV